MATKQYNIRLGVALAILALATVTTIVALVISRAGSREASCEDPVASSP